MLNSAIFDVLTDLAEIVRAGWDLTGPERRKILKIVKWLEIAVWLNILFAVLMFVAATVCEPRTTIWLMPAMTILPAVEFIWILSSWRVFTGLAVVGVAGEIPHLGLARLRVAVWKCVKQLLIIVLGEIILGMFLSVTPLSQRRVLVPLLFLTVAGFIVSLVVTKEGSIIRRGLVIALLVETAAFFLPTLSPGGAAKGVLDQVARATEVAPPWVDRPCIDEATGGQVVFNFAGSDENMVSVPTSRCWTIVTLPPDSEKWHSVPRGQGSWAYYILPIGGDEKVVGPLGWHSPTPVHFLLPEKFLIQSSAENKSVEFWIPADSPEKNPDGDPGN